MSEQCTEEKIALKNIIEKARVTSREVMTHQERTRLNHIIGQSHQQILSLNGKYIKRPLKDSTVASKFILLSQQSYDSVIQETREVRGIDASGNIDAYSKMIPIGRQRFFPLYWPNIWSELSEDNQERLVNRHKSIKNAQKYSNDAICYMITTHEISHLYMDDSLPLWLQETGAYYYSRESVKTMGISARSPNWEPYEKIYDTLEEKFDENLHHTYFGTLEAQLYRLLICLQYSADDSIKKLFPAKNPT
ncbi:MAG: hypothetical protein PHQ59_03740 [Candidatus Daviesbacteria bacterium]|nr:hypothetical protein [Candidatus Daviesbacteria bacterium]